MHISSQSTLVALLRERVHSSGDRIAYIFLGDGETASAELTYRELDRRARVVAAQLTENGCAGKPVLLVYPPGLDYLAGFFGCLYAGAVAVPAYPPDPARPERTIPRLAAVVADAGPAVALTVPELVGILGGLGEQLSVPELAGLRWLGGARDGDPAWTPPELTADSLAFLQYTSGSTGAPKGVLVSHRNLLANLAEIAALFGIDSADRVLSWLPLYHDMGLIGCVMAPLYVGAPAWLMPSTAFLERPARWLRAVHDHRITVTGGPNFAYELSVRKVPEAERADLDLSSWRVAFNGAEPVRPATLRRFAEAFAWSGFTPRAFLPCYGLAEATLLVTGVAANAVPTTRRYDPAGLAAGSARPAGTGRELVSAGIAGPETVVRIVRPDDPIALPEREVGEIWVAGPGVTAGYWGRDGHPSFGARLPGDDRAYLRTGDLGFLDGGGLYLVSRRKDLIILHGRNYYPQDIEQAAETAYPGLRRGCGAAFAVDEDGAEPGVVVVQEVATDLSATELAAAATAIRDAVARQCGLALTEVVLAGRNSVPKTSSGKVRRSACRDEWVAGALAVRYADGDTTAVAPEAVERDDRAELLALPAAERPAAVSARVRQLVGSLLGADLTVTPAGRSLTALGMTSLTAMELHNGLVDRLGVRVPVADLLGELSLGELADMVAAGLERPDERQPADQAAPEGELPLSAGQRAMWLLHRLAPDSRSYNQIFAARAPTGLDLPALRAAVAHVVAAHPVLRITYHDRDGVPYQRIEPAPPLPYTEIDATGWSAERVAATLRDEAHRPFDLAAGPVVRVVVLTGDTDAHLLLCAHHIVADYWSMTVVVAELGAAYSAVAAGRPLPVVPASDGYAEFLLARERGVSAADHDYWRDVFAEPPAALELPTDRPRPAIPGHHGASHEFHLPADVSERLREYARETGTTVYPVLLAAFQALLSRYTGQTDVVVGSPYAGRDQPRFQDTVGYFVSMLPLRTDLSGDPTTAELVERVRRTALAAFAHAGYPAESLADEVRLGRSGLFDAVLILQQPYRLTDPDVVRFVLGTPGRRLTLGDQDTGLVLESVALPQDLARFDLELWLVDTPGELFGSLRYRTELFDAATADRLCRNLGVLLGNMLGEPDRPVAELPVLADGEYRKVTAEWNDTRAPYRDDTLVHELVEDQVRRDPDAVAVVWSGGTWTYGELNARANRLAHHLAEQGLTRAEPVAVLLDRGPDLVTAVLAVLKAGGSYVPLETDHPAARLASIASAVATRWVLTGHDHAALAAGFPTVGNVVCLDRGEAVPGARVWTPADLAGLPVTNPGRRAEPTDRAYTIFTSGSTGAPKGVVETHQPVVNLIDWVNETFHVGPADRVLFVTALSFDLSVYDIFGILAAGGSIHVASGEDVREPRRLVDLLDSGTITFWDSAPAAMARLVPEFAGRSPLSAGRQSLRLAFFSGDWIPVTLPDQLTARYHSLRVIALGGATEATVWSNFHVVDRVDPDWPSIPYGRPIRNARYYVLDPMGAPCPIGVPGELHIGGDCLASGYHGDPELTARSFVPDPFAGRPDARMYRTGDRARFHADGTIEFLGRVGHMVKIRGFRVEPGEVRSALTQHPWVRAADVVAVPDGTGQRLVAYVVPGDSGLTPDQQVSGWRTVFDEVYAAGTAADPTFETAGWVDSATARPFSADEMHEWVTGVVDRLLALPHRRVLEIGCGTGLLLSRVAPHAQRYVGVDQSRSALAHLTGKVLPALDCAGRVELRELAADRIGELSGPFDLVVVNSVAQYFPSVEYLVAVLDAAAGLLADGGALFVGDVRNHALLPAAHAAVLLAGADDADNTAGLATRLRLAVAAERELVVDPELFAAWAGGREDMAGPEVLLKAGEHRNELTAFRYDVLLRRSTEPAVELTHVDWTATDLGDPGNLVRVTDIPNDRVIAAVTAARLLADDTAPDTVAGLRNTASGVDPGIVRNGRVCWPLSGRPDRFDAVFAPPGTAVPGPKREPGSWQRYANSPARGALRHQLVPELRRTLRERVPEYMVPSAFVVLDELPVTANGKLDRAALPAVAEPVGGVDAGFAPPRPGTEETLAGIWAELLGVSRVGRADSFFELGGDSILTTQLVARAADHGLHLTLRSVFDRPTLADLATVAEAEPDPDSDDGGGGGEIPLTPIQRWLFDRDLARPDHFNQAVLLAATEPVDPATLERALRHVAGEHDVFRYRFERTDRWRQTVAGEPRIAIGPVDAGLDLAAGPLLRAEITADHVLLVAHHAVIDAVSWQVLLAEVDTAYRTLRAGGEPVGRRRPSFARWARALAGHADSAEVLGAAGDWLAYLTRPVDPLPGSPGLEGDAVPAERVLPEDVTAVLAGEVCRAFRVDMEEVLLAALVDGLSRWTGQRRIRLDREGHGRGMEVNGIDAAGTVGWLTTLTPTVLTVPDTFDPAELMTAVKDQARAVPGPAGSHALLRHLSHADAPGVAALRAVPAAQISLNYLGRLDRAVAGPFTFAGTGGVRLRAAENQRPYRVEVNASVVGGRLRVELAVDPDLPDPNRLAELMADTLTDLARHAGPTVAYTPGDFPLAGLDTASLGKLIDQVGKEPSR